uniref:3'-5' exonuclease domain-containing protein n=1 Tax=Macrostomum lignano TaxID=282301 RepID=A0A1I8GPD1_9PLAT
MELPGRGSLVVLDSDSQSYTGFFRKMTNDFQFELYDARDENGRYIGKVCVPLDQVSKLLVSEEMSDPESCSSCGESSIESSATAAAAAAATESRLTCSSPGSRTASEEPAAARQNNFGQKPFLPPKCPVPKHYGGILLGSNEKHQHGMLNLLPEVDATSCLPDGFIYDANFNEATNANCILVTTAIGVERALAVLATADLLAVLCHGGNLRGQAKTSSRPSLISVAMPINDINSRVFLFDLDSCTAAAMSGLAKLLSSCREPYNRHLVVVSYDCRLLKRHLPMLDCSANDASVKFVDLQVLSTTLQQLYSDGKCSHACRGLYCLMQTYLGKPDPYKEPRAREDFLVEDSAVWRRRPLHPALLVASYDKSRQVLPLYNEMLSALLNPVYRASKDRIQLAKAEESGLPSNYFCSIPSQAALDQMRNLHVKGDAADSAQQSRGRCRGGSSAALQQRQQQSPCSPITSSTANSTVGSLTPNHSSLPSFGFGRGRGGSGGS